VTAALSLAVHEGREPLVVGSARDAVVVAGGRTGSAVAVRVRGTARDRAGVTVRVVDDQKNQ